MGGPGLARGLPIFSFNVRVGASWLHPRFVTTLLNDLFGIQSRAGCSCAAPYGHRLLHIDHDDLGPPAADHPARQRRAEAGVDARHLPLPAHRRGGRLHRGSDPVRGRPRRGVPARLPVRRAHGRVAPPRRGRRAGPRSASTRRSRQPRSPRPRQRRRGRARGRCSTGTSRRRGRLADELARRHAGVELKTTEKDLVPFVYV